MMGHKERLSGGDEWDAFHRRSRQMLGSFRRPGIAKKAKALFARRVRRLARLDAAAEAHSE